MSSGIFRAINRENGLVSTILPVNDRDEQLLTIVPQFGYLWFSNPFKQFESQLCEQFIAQQVSAQGLGNYQVRIQRLDFDVSIAVGNVAPYFERLFRQGFNFVHSSNNQPVGRSFFSLPVEKWPRYMVSNAITMVAHRPALGEPTKIWSLDEELVSKAIELYK